MVTIAEAEKKKALSLQKQTGEEVECIWCSSTFKKKRFFQVFCSSTCRNGYHKAQREEAFSLLRERNKE